MEVPLMQRMSGQLSRIASRIAQALGFKQSPPTPTVIVHDPESSGPHNLDDPFFDEEVQGRVAAVIARSARPRATEGK